MIQQGLVEVTRHLRPAVMSLAVAALVACGADKPAVETSESSAAPAVVAPEKGAIVISPNDSRSYATLALENGLEVILVSDPAVEKSAAALSVGVGLLFDPMEYQGMAHYLEHMLFLGTSKYPTPDEYMEFMSQNGGANNAYTWLDITNYMFEVKNSAYPEALDRFADFFKTPKLDPTYIDKEKNAVNAEWSMRREMDYFAKFKLERALLGDHPANRFLIGNLESLADKEGSSLHEATVNFYNQYYSSNIMKLALISERPIDEMKAMAETYFGDIVNKEIEDPTVTTELDFSLAAGKLIRMVPQEDQRTLQLDFIIDNNSAEFRVKPNAYLGYIIGSEMPNTPAARIKELGWGSSLSAGSSAANFGNYGLFSVTVDLTEEGMAHREEMTQMILGYIEMLREQGVDDRYAAEFRTSLANQFQFLEKTDDFNYATSLAAAMQDFPIEHAIDAPYRFENFDGEAVQRVLDQLTPERLRVWHISKEEEVDQEMHFYAGTYSVAPLELAPREAWLASAGDKQLALPALNTLLPEAFEVAETSAEPAKVLEEEGLEIWQQGSEYFPDQPKGYTQLYINTDARIESAEGAVMLALWDDLYQLAQTALFTEAGIAGMSGNASVADGLRLSVSGFTDKQPELIEKALAGLRIAPSQQELDQAVDRFLRGLQNDKRSFPVQQLFPAMSQLTRAGRWDEAQLIAAAESVNLESMAAFVDNVLTRNQLRAYMFGSYSRESADALASAIKTAMPEREVIPYQRAAVFQPQPGQSLAFNRELPVEDLGMMYLFAAPNASLENEARGRVLSAHLGNRAFSQLRTEEQLGYAAGGFATMLDDQPMVGFYIQTPVKNPVDMLARFESFKSEYRDMLAELTEEEFTNLKAGVITTLTQPPKNLAEEAGPFLTDWNRERYSYDTRAKLVAAAEGVTLEQIRAYYDETVMAESPSRILVQLRGKAFADDPYAMLEGAEVVENVADFHKTMPTQTR